MPELRSGLAGEHVSDGQIAMAIGRVRRMLNRASRDREFILSVRGRGYLPVREVVIRDARNDDALQLRRTSGERPVVGRGRVLRS